MIPTLNVKADLKEVRDMASEYQQRRVPQAAARAINRTLTNVRTEASKQIRTERALSATTVRDALKINKAYSSSLHGDVTASGRPIPLREYNAHQTKAGVTVMVTPGQRKLVVSFGNKAFIVASLGGHVFVRRTSERLPIKKRYGPSIPATFVKEKVIAAIDKVAGDQWSKNFQHELDYAFKN